MGAGGGNFHFISPHRMVASAQFTGLYRHNLDEKGRLTVPKVWRDAWPEGTTYLATPQPDGYIVVLPPDGVAALRDKLQTMAMGNAKAQAFIARFGSQTQSFSYDAGGRVMLTEELKKHAGITDKVVLVGTLGKYQIYSPERWAKEEEATAGENFGAFMRELNL